MSRTPLIYRLLLKQSSIKPKGGPESLWLQVRSNDVIDSAGIYEAPLIKHTLLQLVLFMVVDSYKSGKFP